MNAPAETERHWRYEAYEPVMVNTDRHPTCVQLPDGSWLVCRSMVDARAVCALLRLLVVEQVDRQGAQP